ncbi:MAG: YHS domain protein [Ignavibacteriae bacterium]|nr:YHS domain protein [Ignavibacteriota bacterium]MCB9208138.1 YHS domain protein [Ignavibacteriales bacterium]MCB9258903.1 YHS domain protein [Ignavibacteriales bacterium]
MSFGNFMKVMFYSLVTILFTLFVVAYFMNIMPISFGLHSKIYKSSNVAMDGYDIVNYFSKKVNKGDLTFNYKLNDLNWFFTNRSNLLAFKARPDKYIPQFGGYCPYYVSKGFTHPPDPNVWHIEKGKIYFFSSEENKKLALSTWEFTLDKAKSHWK